MSQEKEGSLNGPLIDRPRTLRRRPIFVEEVPEEDEKVEVKYTIKEIYSFIPRHLMEDMFDHMDLRQASRLSRVSSSWAFELKQIPKRAMGTAYLEDCANGRMLARREELGEGGELLPWSTMLSKSDSVKSVMLVDIKDSWLLSAVFRDDRDASDFRWTLEPLSRLTLGKGFCGSMESLILFRRACGWAAALRTCVIRFRTHFKLAAPTAQCKAMFQEAQKLRGAGSCPGNVGNVNRPAATSRDICYVSWTMDMRCPRLDQWYWHKQDGGSEHLQELWEAIDNPYIYDDDDDDEQRRLVRREQRGKSIWPYPKEQLQWLLGSLEGLQGEVLETVRYLDEMWKPKSEWDYWSKLHKRNLTTQATCDGRKLNSMDLAFFGRLLVTIDQYAKIPDLKPPPIAFPDDFHFNFCPLLKRSNWDSFDTVQDFGPLVAF